MYKIPFFVAAKPRFIKSHSDFMTCYGPLRIFQHRPDNMTTDSNIRRFSYLFVVVVLCIVASFFIWLVIKGLEGEPPSLSWERPVESIGRSYTLKGVASDQKSGLQRIWIAVMQQGKEFVLLDQTFPSQGLLRKGAVLQQPVSVEIKVYELGLKDGEAILRTALWDYSYRGWLSGNQSYAEHRVVVDTKPPTIEMVSRNHNMNQGGAGLAVYRVSEPVASTGIQVANRFFPGSRGYFADPNTFVAFFALPYDKGPEARLHVIATDHAGNVARTGFLRHINARSFRKDNVNVSDAFLKQKMPEFEESVGKDEFSGSLLEKFLKVNRDMRQANRETINTTCGKSDAKQHWQGQFLRLPASARKAGFADHRTYRYKGRTVDKQVHLGIDLASTANSPVPAANSGRVAFSENLGIYGQTVIIDHGFSLFSIYSHLSRIGVTKDQMVSKSEIIGLTGDTGMAGGDHLHFGILIHGTFVNPIEWWDPNWIRHNITDKLRSAEERTGVTKKETSL